MVVVKGTAVSIVRATFDRNISGAVLLVFVVLCCIVLVLKTSAGMQSGRISRDTSSLFWCSLIATVVLKVFSTDSVGAFMFSDISS